MAGAALLSWHGKRRDGWRGAPGRQVAVYDFAALARLARVRGRGLLGMFWLGDWQLHRALAGNALSWAYTFEWPIFALMGAVFWGQDDPRRDPHPQRPGDGTPRLRHAGPAGRRDRPGQVYYGG
jgi:hypothetical protein